MHMPKESRPVTRTGLQVLVLVYGKLMTSDNWLAMCGKRLQMAISFHSSERISTQALSLIGCRSTSLQQPEAQK